MTSLSSEDIAHKPAVLYRASAERMDAAWGAYKYKDYVLAMYLAGLSVECILQAIALNDDSTHDAKHDLTRWLARCRASLQDRIKDESVIESWSFVVQAWRNNLRYLSNDGLLGFLRRTKLTRYISGGPEAIMRVNAKRLLDAAELIHNIGVAAWNRYTGK